MSDDNEEQNLKGLRNKDHLTMVDRIKGMRFRVMDRDDMGRVTYPRRDYYQNQADQRKREADEIAKKKGGG